MGLRLLQGKRKQGMSKSSDLLKFHHVIIPCVCIGESGLFVPETKAYRSIDSMVDPRLITPSVA